MTQRELRLREIVENTLRICIRWNRRDSRTYWRPLVKRLGIEMPAKCAVSGLVGHFGKLFPFFFWVNRVRGWQEEELWQRMYSGPNGDLREFFGSSEIFEMLRQMTRTKNGIRDPRARWFANQIIDDCTKPQQRIGWVIDKPSSLD